MYNIDAKRHRVKLHSEHSEITVYYSSFEVPFLTFIWTLCDIHCRLHRTSIQIHLYLQISEKITFFQDIRIVESSYFTEEGINNSLGTNVLTYRRCMETKHTLQLAYIWPSMMPYTYQPDVISCAHGQNTSSALSWYFIIHPITFTLCFILIHTRLTYKTITHKQGNLGQFINM